MCNVYIFVYTFDNGDKKNKKFRERNATSSFCYYSFDDIVR